MKRWWWTVCMAWVLWREGFAYWWDAYTYAKDDCWQEFRHEGFSPRDAWHEDLMNDCG